MTKTEFVDMVVNNHKSGQWLSCIKSVQLENGCIVFVGVKAYGKWVQKMRVTDTMTASQDGTCEVETIKAFRSAVSQLLESLIATCEHRTAALL